MKESGNGADRPDVVRAQSMEPLLTPHEVARVLRVGRVTLRRLVIAGKIRTVKFGGRVFFERAEVERLIRDNTH